MNPRTIIAGAFDAIDRYPGVLNITEEDSYLPHADVVLAALRRAAGGADRVVLAWEPTPCATCRGDGHLGPATGAEQRDYGRECQACGGSGVDGYTVTLQTLERPVSVYEKHTFGDGTHQMAPRYDLFELVAVSPEPPKEPTDA
jgi:hypothetical protein